MPRRLVLVAIAKAKLFQAISARPVEEESEPRELRSFRHALLKLGFTLDGTLRQRCIFHGQYFDQLYFGPLEDEWHHQSRLVRRLSPSIHNTVIRAKAALTNTMTASSQNWTVSWRFLI